MHISFVSILIPLMAGKLFMTDSRSTPIPAQPTMRGGWHAPATRAASARQAAAPTEAAPDWKGAALPPEVAAAAEEVGAWHLPAAQDTPFTPGQQILIRDGQVLLPQGPRPEDVMLDWNAPAPAAAAVAPAAPAPEDFVPGPAPAARTAAPAPEDFAVPAAPPAPADPAPIPAPAAAAPVSAPAPEEFDFGAAPAAAAQVLLPDDDPFAPAVEEAPAAGILRPEDGTGALDALEDALQDLEDDDEEAFKVSELAALASIGTGAGAAADLSGLNVAAMSPAEKALFNAATQAEELMPAAQKPAGEEAADVAKRMAQLYASGEAATLDMPATDAATVVPAAGDAADYARRMAQQFGGAASAPAAPALTPQQAALAQRFIETQNQVASLRQMYSAGQMSYDDLRTRLQTLTIQDDAQNYWMMGFDSDKWYQYDSASQQWQEATPPVPLGGSAMTDVMSGSMPYFPDQAAAGQEYSDPYQTATLAPTAAMPAAGGIPRPGQPMVDYDATMVGQAAHEEYLSGAQPTYAGTPAYDSTMPSAATLPGAAAYDNAAIQAPMGTTEPPNYDPAAAYAPQFDQLKKQERSSATRYLLIGLAGLLACGIVSAIAGFLGVMAWYNNEVAPYQEAIDGLADYSPPFQTARILDARGQVIAELNSQAGGAREVVRLEDISPFLLHAIISVENETFYEDPGFSVPAIGRAFLQNLSADAVESGASTITQQIARNLILQDTEATAGRKIREVLVANRIAEQYDKNFILALYVNQFFFGNQSYGVEAAAQFYFGKSAAEVNMAEAAMLASLIQSPAGNDPVVNREQSKNATRGAIRLMLEKGCIFFQHGPWAAGGASAGQPFCIEPSTQTQTRTTDPATGAPLVIVRQDGGYGGALSIQLAQVETRQYLPRQARFKYPHFVNFIQSLVEAEFGPDAMFQRGFTIYTTLEPRVQDEAQNQLAQQVAALVNNGVNTGAVMAIDPTTGAIRAFVGSPDFNNQQFAGQVDNTRTFQQPGSSIKPVVYAAAMEASPTGQYLTPASILWDVPSSYNIAGQQPYTPVNFDRQFRGPVSLRYALQNSLNIPAVKAFEFIGAERFREMATRLGLNYVEGSIFGLPSALGANDVRLIDMMKVYGTIANNGTYVPLYAIERITEDAGGTEIPVVMAERAAPAQRLSPQLAYLLQNILADDASRRDQFGINGDLSLARLNLPTSNYVGAKSGTSDGNRDLWTMGFTRNTVVGVWLGTFDNATTNANSLAAARVWNEVMEAAVAGRTPQPFTNPGGVIQGTVCRDTGTGDDPNCPTRTTDIWIQQQPPPPAGQGFIQTLSIDSWTNMLANEWCAENQVQETFANIADPFAVQWLNTTTQGRAFKQRLGLPDNLPAPPAQACSQGMVLPSIRLNNPSAGQTLTGTVTLTGQISAPDLSRFELLYAPASSPQSFQGIAPASSQQFPNAGSSLATWNTALLPNGQYIVRLAAYSQAGGYIFRDVTVTLNNIPPTPTPAPIVPTPIPPIAPQFTPLPFDNNNPGVPGGLPTPTATLGGI